MARAENPPLNVSSKPGSYNILDPAVIKAFSTNFDPSDPFWSSLLGLSPISGTSGEAFPPLVGSPLVPIYHPVLSILSTLFCTLTYRLLI